MAIWAALGGIFKGGGAKKAAASATKGTGSAIGGALKPMTGANTASSQFAGSAAKSMNAGVPKSFGTIGGANNGLTSSSLTSLSSGGINSGSLSGVEKNRFWGGEGNKTADSFSKILDPSGVLVGLGQSTLAAIQKRNAKSMIPTYATAPERALFSETQRMRRAYQSNIPWYQMAAANIEEKTAANRAFKYGGRSALGALNANLQAQKAQIAQQAAANAANLIGQEAEMTKYSGSIARDAQMLKVAMGSAEAASRQAAGGQNLALKADNIQRLLASIGANYKKNKSV